MAVRISKRPIRAGSGWRVCCPGHDDRDPSLVLHPRHDGTGVWIHCYGGCDWRHVARILRTEYGIETGPEQSAPRSPHHAKTEAIQWTHEPEQIPNGRERLEHYTLGTPVHVATYTGPSGLPYVGAWMARYAPPNPERGKETRPWSWWRSTTTGQAVLRCAMPPAPRPLYRSERLREPERTVLIPEGEPACEWLGRHAPDADAITWMGGSNAWTKADWTPVTGRHVILLPDNDPAGLHAAQRIAMAIAPIVASIAVRRIWREVPALDGNDERGKGWDVADWGKGSQRMRAIRAWGFTQWRRQLAADDRLRERTPI